MARRLLKTRVFGADGTALIFGVLSEPFWHEKWQNLPMPAAHRRVQETTNGKISGLHAQTALDSTKADRRHHGDVERGITAGLRCICDF